MIEELEKIRNSLRGEINTTIDRLIKELENPSSVKDATNAEYDFPLSANPAIFIGKKPVAVLFGEERVAVKSWREVYSAVLSRCNEDLANHERLMYLRNKTAGKVRVFLSDRPDSMRSPAKIDEGLFGETHYGSQTLIHILCKRILDYTAFDYRNIKIVLKP